MADDTVSTAQLSSAALREWHQHVEAMMRGVAHSLNNRAAALSAVLELSREPADDDMATDNILGAELERVRELAELVRLVGPPRAGAEAFAPDEAVQQAIAVLRLHADHNDHVTLVQARGAPPVRVERWMFVRAVIVLAAGARAPASRAVAIQLTGNGDWLEVRLDDDAAPPVASVYVTELVAAMAGEMLGTGGFRIPTLASVRLREGR
jgi:hypothetical protein